MFSRGLGPSAPPDLSADLPSPPGLLLETCTLVEEVLESLSTMADSEPFLERCGGALLELALLELELELGLVLELALALVLAAEVEVGVLDPAVLAEGGCPPCLSRFSPAPPDVEFPCPAWALALELP